MNITSHISPRDLAGISPEKLSSSSSVSQEQKVEELARQFEAVLLRKILSEAHKPLFGGGLLPENSTNAIYQDMIVSHLADSIVRAQALGIADSLKQQLVPATSGKGTEATKEL